MSASIELQGLEKRFGAADDGFIAVRGIDARINAGEFVTLLGESGCGKTTTLRMIAGLDMPTAGKILLDGEEITDVPASDRDMRMVFQDYALFPNMSVAQNVGFGLTLKRNRERFAGIDIAARIQEYLRLVQLESHGDKRPSQLSGGQQQRTSLARALITNPSVVLFDEPLGSLDANLRKAMQFELKRIHSELGKTFIYVTHDQEEALAMSDRIAVMADGQILQMGTPEEIYFEPNCRYVASFIGAANVMDAEIEEAGHDSTAVRLTNGERLKVAGNGVSRGDPDMSIMIRSDKLKLAAEPENDGRSWLRGRVNECLFLGDKLEYLIELAQGAGRITVHDHQASERLFQDDQAVAVGVRPEDARLLRG
ncbi:MAG TPA: ABC transporter ATP-binding protein [Arenicellales bacterium]|nr:ABC transporter ATP-binding protein [Arenicellales bacterium]